MSPSTDEILVCFDAGGVLVRICRTWEEGCAAAGLDRPALTQHPERIARLRALTHAYQAGRIGCDVYFEAMSRATGGVCSPADMRRIHDAWLLEDYPGATELLLELARTPRVATAVLSNTNHRHWVRLHPGSSGHLPHFSAVSHAQHRHASHLLGLCKPDHAIFREFERRTGLPPGRIIYFDDLQANVDAARAGGWNAHLVNHAADPIADARTVLTQLRLL